jgi:hypothetical protein
MPKGVSPFLELADALAYCFRLHMQGGKNRYAEALLGSPPFSIRDMREEPYGATVLGAVKFYEENG